VDYEGATIFAYYTKSSQNSSQVLQKNAHEIFVWFGWRNGHRELRECMKSQRTDLLEGHQDFLRLINLLGSIYLGAQISLHSAQAHEEIEKNIYMNFSPYGGTYVQPGEYGSYVSMSPNVDTICAKMERASRVKRDEDDENVHKGYFIKDHDTRVILWVACVYDFMAYSAQRLRKEINEGIMEEDIRKKIYFDRW
jgi:hypothetical protein